MKTKLLALFLALIIAAAFVTSCAGNGAGSPEGEGGSTEGGGGSTEGDSGEGEGEEEKTSKYEYKHLVYDKDVTNNGISPLAVIGKYQNIVGKRLAGKMNTAADGITEGAVSLGETGLDVSAAAINKLNEHLLATEDLPWDTASYIIYSDGKSVAVYWNNNYVADDALNKFYELLEAETDFTDGFAEIQSTQFLAAKEAAEAELLENTLAKVTKALGEEAAEALKDHMALAKEDYYIWLANLYQPRTCVCTVYDNNGTRICQLPKDENGEYLCHGGGFYYSNSARDTEGFFIDIESTKQALSFLVSSGMLQGYNDSTNAALPAQMKADLVAFAKSLQSAEDGYFYHPQWGTDISVSRKSRDLNWAIDVIRQFGATPLYDTPTGLKGEFGAPWQTSALTSPLTQSTATAVAKLQLCATVWPDHLKSAEAFEEYINAFNFETASYSAGNTLTSQSSQIKARDNEGLKNGEFVDADKDGIADNGLIAVFERLLNEKQNPENGLWQDSVHYNSVNGLMKISSAYTNLGVKLPYAEKALASAVEMVLLDADTADIKGKRPTGSVDVYNPWVAITKIFSNMYNTGSENLITALRADLREQAADMIRVTTEKAKKFAKEDGSYGYTWSTSPAYSQSAPVAVPGTVEGDVNGGGIALQGIWGSMLSGLGIHNIGLTLFFDSDFDKFIYEIGKLPTYEKSPAP